ncbi:MAG: transporter related [Planctomycetaceae bacterium]|nr:transporter related [Planctomycetaceae bacterium]
MDAEIPSEIINLIGTSHLQGHSLLLATKTDLDEVGHTADQWLLVTERECAVAVRGDALRGVRARTVRTFLFEHIDGCRVQTEIGSGYLQVCHNGVWIDLLRFSNRLTPQFRDVAHKLEQLRRFGEFHVEPNEDDGDNKSPTPDTTKPDSRAKRSLRLLQTLGRVFQLLRPFRAKAAVIAILSIVSVAIELAPPWLQKILVDNILAGKEPSSPMPQLLITLVTIVGCLALIRLVAAVLAVWKSKLSSDIGTRLTADLRMQMVDKLQRLSVSYHDRNQVGMLMSRVSYDTEAMHTFMYQISGGFFLQLLQLFAIGIMLFVLNAKLALLTLLPMPLVLIASWFYCRYLYARHHQYWDAVGHQATALTSLLSGIRVVKSFTQEPREQSRFSTTSERLRESRLGLDLANATFSSLIGFLFGLGGLIVWYVGGRDVLMHDMTLGSLMAFLAYLSMFYAPLTTISEGATWISSFLAASHRIFELLDTPVSVEEPVNPQSTEQLQGHIKFDHVSFSYDDQKPALEDLTFEIRQGESIGIVGRSGSGKSTLVCLVSRLYDVDSGQINIDGIDVRRINTTQLRRHVGMVLQEPFLFEGTVASNIAYGDPDALPETIITSAKAASAHDFILRMPFSYETLLGEGGTGLSGGERQRVSIARAILYDPKILILDEATSSIDTESERLIQQAVERFSRGRTTLAIAHRLSTLENVDRLLVLDQGKLVEQGSHQELLATSGVYAHLTRLQFGAAHEGLPSLSTTVVDEAESASMLEEASERTSTDATKLDWEVRWLCENEARFFLGAHEILSLEIDGHEFAGVYTIRAFPATHSEAYLSIRYGDADRHDRELGMIRKLEGWPVATQDLIRRSLNRRYLLRQVQGLLSLREDNGFVNCSAETDDGRVDFVVHNTPRAVKHFGYNGRLLTDLDQNHFLIADLDMLPALQRRLFRQLFGES